MKVSIWRQFSSNHSANFTVVGEFDSPSLAEQAEEKLNAVYNQLAAWWESLDKDTRVALSKTSDMKQLTPIERQLKEEWGVTWEYSLNWFSWRNYRYPIYRYENFVFVTDPCDLWHGPQPFDEMLQKLGGKVNLEVFESYSNPQNSQLVLDIRCRLPSDEENATLLYLGLKEDFAAYHRFESWPEEVEYHPNFKLSFVADISGFQHYTTEEGIYKVERKGGWLYIWGVFFEDYTCDERRKRLEMEEWRTILEKEGCLEITFSFRTILLYKK